MFLPPVELD